MPDTEPLVPAALELLDAVAHYDERGLLHGVGLPPPEWWSARLLEVQAQAAERAVRPWREVTRDLLHEYHHGGSIRDHADPNDKTGWNVHGVETCEDSLCLDARALLSTPTGGDTDGR